MWKATQLGGGIFNLKSPFSFPKTLQNIQNRSYHKLNGSGHQWKKELPRPVDFREGVWLNNKNMDKIRFINELWYGRMFDYWNATAYDPPCLFHSSVVDHDTTFTDRLITRGSKVVYMNRTADLNSLNLEFTKRLRGLFEKYTNQTESSYGTFLQARDQTFSTGTDFVEIYNNMHSGPEGIKKVSEFFQELYALSNAMGNAKLPCYFVNDGFTLGSAASISVVSGANVCTHRTVLSWPENDIGFFVDAGGTWKLSRLPSEIGTYMALTGSRIEGFNAELAGLAGYAMDPAQAGQVRAGLDCTGKNPKLREMWLQCGLSESVPFALRKHIATIRKCFRYKTMEEIMQALSHEAFVEEDVWAKRQLNKLLQKSPMSLKITLKLLNLARDDTLYECLHREYIVAHNLLFDKESDFYKGVKQLIIDNKNPDRTSKGIRVAWKYNSISDVPDSEVDKYFQSLPDGVPQLNIALPNFNTTQEAMKKFNRKIRVAWMEHREKYYDELIAQAYQFTTHERIERDYAKLKSRVEVCDLPEKVTAALKEVLKLYEAVLRSPIPEEFMIDKFIGEHLPEPHNYHYHCYLVDKDIYDNSEPIYEHKYLYLKDEIQTDETASQQYQAILDGKYEMYQVPFRETVYPSALGDWAPLTLEEIKETEAEIGHPVPELYDYPVNLPEEAPFEEWHHRCFMNAELPLPPPTHVGDFDHGDPLLYDDLPPFLYDLSVGDEVIAKYDTEKLIYDQEHVYDGYWHNPLCTDGQEAVRKIEEYLKIAPPRSEFDPNLIFARMKTDRRLPSKDNKLNWKPLQ